MVGGHCAHPGHSDHQMLLLFPGEVRKGVTKTSTLGQQSPRRLESLQEGNPTDTGAGRCHMSKEIPGGKKTS